MFLLPWPDKALHPNARVHWAKRSKAAKAARQHANWSALAAKPHLGFDPRSVERLRATLTFSPPDRRRRDLDGMLSAMKSSIDGIADAVGIDDSNFEITINRAEPVKGGQVLVKLEPA